MANDIYIVDQLATGILTVTVDDDGSGRDWLVFEGVYAEPTDIRLGHDKVNGTSTSASGFYFNPGNDGHRLIVNGLIENVRGSNGEDFIQGNEIGNLVYGDAAATGPGGNDTIDGFDGNDTLYGGSGNDSLHGGSDRDRLFGNGGNDSLNGGLGIDTIEGGVGADYLSGGADNGDTVSFASSWARVIVSFTFGMATTGQGGHAQGDQITGFTHAYGSAYGDIFTDTVKNEISSGYNANGFFGGAGNDRLILGGGRDTGRGGIGDDVLFGEQGNDALFGDAGNDVLRGGDGVDRLTGGGGGDRFVFVARTESLPAARDAILDFSRAQGDRIDLLAIDANAGATGNGVFSFVGETGFTGARGVLRTVETLSGWRVLGDTNGDRIADFAIDVTAPGISNLRSGDFIL